MIKFPYASLDLLWPV